MSLDPLLLSRIQFGFTVSFHIIFPAFTIGLAAWLATMEGMRLATGNRPHKPSLPLMQSCKLLIMYSEPAGDRVSATTGHLPPGALAGESKALIEYEETGKYEELDAHNS